jgi:hypothetical protein
MTLVDNELKQKAYRNNLRTSDASEISFCTADWEVTEDEHQTVSENVLHLLKNVLKS